MKHYSQSGPFHSCDIFVAVYLNDNGQKSSLIMGGGDPEVWPPSTTIRKRSNHTKTAIEREREKGRRRGKGSFGFAAAAAARTTDLQPT